MAVTSSGFSGGVTEQTWAAYIGSNAGSPYSVYGTNDLIPTINTSADRTISIAAGTAFGHGVQCINSAQATAQCGTIGSGTRWDLIALRRDWTANTGAFVVVAGTSTRQMPAGRNAAPGSLDDQPIALVQLTAGSTLPTQLVDLRAFPSKVITCADLLAIPAPVLGMEAVVNNVRWRYQLDATSNPAWAQDLSPYAARTLTPVVGSAVSTAPVGWTSNGMTQEATRNGNDIQLYVESRTSTDIPITAATGNISDQFIATLNALYWPARRTSIRYEYKTNTGGLFWGDGAIDPNGIVTLLTAQPNSGEIAGQGAGIWSIRFNAHYIVNA